MSVVKRIEENLSTLDNLLGKDNVEDIKKRIGDLLVERIANDMEVYDRYLFYPGDYEDTINAAFKKVGKKIEKMYSDAITRFKDVALSTVNDTPGIKLRSCHKCKYKDGNKCKFYDMYYWRAHDSICAEEGFINFEEKVD